VFLQPTRDVDYRDAEKALRIYLKARQMGIERCREWARWTYGEMPFWSMWGLVYGFNEVFSKCCGIHIYDDGRVEIVSSTENYAEIKKLLEVEVS